MTDALSLLKTRASVPSFNLGEPGPDQAQIEELLTIASRVPDHGKLAPWRFIIYRGDARFVLSERIATRRREKEPGVADVLVEQDRKRFAEAPVIIGIVSRAAPHVKIPEWEQVLSAGAAATSLLIAANAMGFSAQWLTSWAAYDPEARAILGLADWERVIGFIHIGTPKGPPIERPRPALADIVTEWKP